MVSSLLGVSTALDGCLCLLALIPIVWMDKQKRENTFCPLTNSIWCLVAPHFYCTIHSRETHVDADGAPVAPVPPFLSERSSSLTCFISLVPIMPLGSNGPSFCPKYAISACNLWVGLESHPVMRLTHSCRATISLKRPSTRTNIPSLSKRRCNGKFLDLFLKSCGEYLKHLVNDFLPFSKRMVVSR